jgi:hypothetical protein
MTRDSKNLRALTKNGKKWLLVAKRPPIDEPPPLIHSTHTCPDLGGQWVKSAAAAP